MHSLDWETLVTLIYVVDITNHWAARETKRNVPLPDMGGPCCFTENPISYGRASVLNLRVTTTRKRKYPVVGTRNHKFIFVAVS